MVKRDGTDGPAIELEKSYDYTIGRQKDPTLSHFPAAFADVPATHASLSRYRNPDCDIRINLSTVSSTHARIECRENGKVILTLRSVFFQRLDFLLVGRRFGWSRSPRPAVPTPT